MFMIDAKELQELVEAKRIIEQQKALEAEK